MKTEEILKNLPSENKFYLTKKGLENLEKKYKKLLSIRRSKAEGETPEIFHSEDLNPEYLSFLEDTDLLDKKISDLEYSLKNAEIIHPPLCGKNIVDLGAKISLEIDGIEDKLEVVGTLEANPSLGKISNESPVGRALLGHKTGDEVIISSPIKTVYKIKKISY